MSDDTDLARLFLQDATPEGSDAFVAGVTTRIARRRRLALAAPAAMIVALLLAVWATWPAARTLAVSSLGGIDLLAHGVSGFFNSDVGTAVAAALALSLASWAFATGRLRAYFG